jgi:hypothetical protein
MRKSQKRLKISKDTLRALSVNDLSAIGGGDPTSHFTVCQTNCTQCKSFAGATCPP